jgi:hypothetical protein
MIDKQRTVVRPPTNNTDNYRLCDRRHLDGSKSALGRIATEVRVEPRSAVHDANKLGDPGRDLALDFVCDSAPRHTEYILGLQSNPELWRRSKIARQT